MSIYVCLYQKTTKENDTIELIWRFSRGNTMRYGERLDAAVSRYWREKNSLRSSYPILSRAITRADCCYIWGGFTQPPTELNWPFSRRRASSCLILQYIVTSLPIRVLLSWTIGLTYRLINLFNSQECIITYLLRRSESMVDDECWWWMIARLRAYFQ